MLLLRKKNICKFYCTCTNNISLGTCALIYLYVCVFIKNHLPCLCPSKTNTVCLLCWYLVCTCMKGGSTDMLRYASLALKYVGTSTQFVYQFGMYCSSPLYLLMVCLQWRFGMVCAAIHTLVQGSKQSSTLGFSIFATTLCNINMQLTYNDVHECFKHGHGSLSMEGKNHP